MNRRATAESGDSRRIPWSPPLDQTPIPTAIEQRSPTRLGIRWAAGADTETEVQGLSLACACAECVDEWSGQARLDPDTIPADVHPVSIQSVGRYAIQIEWSDGHSAGIYPFRRLRELA